MSEKLAEQSIAALCSIHNRKAASTSMKPELGASGNLTIKGKLPSWLLGAGYIVSYQQDIHGMASQVIIARSDVPQFLAHLQAILRGIDHRNRGENR